MAEFNLDDADHRKHDVVVLQTIQPHHALVKTNRVLLMLVCALMLAVFVMGLFLLPRQNVLEQLTKQQLINPVSGQNSVLSAEINTLKGQMFGLVSGSIDGKLKSLEDNLRRGSIADSLENLQDIKGDVKILTSYTQENAGRAEQVAVEQTVIKELSELKGIIYLTLVSCGLMLAALAGVWLRQRYRITHQNRPSAYLGRKE